MEATPLSLGKSSITTRLWRIIFSAFCKDSELNKPELFVGSAASPRCPQKNLGFSLIDVPQVTVLTVQQTVQQISAKLDYPIRGTSSL